MNAKLDDKILDVWPFSLEFTCVLALIVLPYVGFLLGYQMALETVK